MVTGLPPALRMSTWSAWLRPDPGCSLSPRRRSAPSASRAPARARAPSPPNSSRSCVGQRAFVGGAQQVRREHVGVAGVDQGGLVGAAEQVGGVVQEVGVERVVLADQHGQGRPALAARPAGLLPHRGHGSRVAVEHDRVQAADVHAQLQGVGGGQPEQPARDQPLLQLAPLLGQVAGPVGADPSGQAAVDLGHPVAGEAGHQLGRLARAGEAQGPHPGLDGGGQPGGRLGVGAAPQAGRLVQQRRLPEGEGDRAARGAVLGDRLDRQADQPGGQLGRVAEGGRGEHEGRAGPVAGGQAAQAAQDRGHVGAEHAAQGVGLVDDHVGEPAEEGRPALVAGEDAAVEHVRVGQHQVGAAPDHRAVGGRGVAVVGRRPDPGQGEGADGAELVAGQGLGGGEVQRGAVALAEQGVEHRELVAEALAGGGAGGHHHVAPGAGQVDRRRLMGPERLQAPGGQPRAHHLGQVAGRLRQPRRPGRQALQMHELATVVGVAGEVVHQRDRVGHAVMVAATRTSPTDPSPGDQLSLPARRRANSA